MQRPGHPGGVRCTLFWTRVAAEYVFDGPDGKVTLASLFDGCSQLNVYHVTIDPRWRERHIADTRLADCIDALAGISHLGVSRAAVSRAPLPEIEAFRNHMGWRFPWVSSFHGSFNFDYYTSFTKSHGPDRSPAGGPPVVNAFRMDDAGSIVHAYSAYVDDGDLPLLTRAVDHRADKDGAIDTRLASLGETAPMSCAGRR